MRMTMPVVVAMGRLGGIVGGNRRFDVAADLLRMRVRIREDHPAGQVGCKNYKREEMTGH